MSVAASRRLVVVLDPEPGPIAGSLQNDEGVWRRFAGWLELCALLEAARAPADEPRSPQEDSECCIESPS